MKKQTRYRKLHPPFWAGIGRKIRRAQKTFFSPDIVSIELADAEGNRKKSEGIGAISTNRENFQAIVASVEGLKTTAPVVYGNSFAFGFELDFTAKGGSKQLLEVLGRNSINIDENEAAIILDFLYLIAKFGRQPEDKITHDTLSGNRTSQKSAITIVF